MQAIHNSVNTYEVLQMMVRAMHQPILSLGFAFFLIFNLKMRNTYEVMSTRSETGYASAQMHHAFWAKYQEAMTEWIWTSAMCRRCSVVLVIHA